MVDNAREQSVVLDLPPEIDADKGPTALELGVMSSTGCTATILSLMAKRNRASIKDLKVTLEAQKRPEAHTITEANVVVLAETD